MTRLMRCLFVVVGAWAILAIVPDQQVAANVDDEWETGVVNRVEEDWSLTIDKPDPDRGSPQVATQMIRAPYASRFANLTLNSCDFPSYSQGGLQLLCWKGRTNLSTLASANRNVLRTADELITWTQYLKRDGSSLKFGVSNASSQTWGNFGGIEVTLSSMSKYLDNYSADYSQQNSGVTFGANRVKSMVLVAVRRYFDDGTYTTDSTPRVIFSSTLDSSLNPVNPGAAIIP